MSAAATTRTSLNSRLKHWPGWLLLAAVAAALIAVGASRDHGPSNNAERIDAIAKQLRCPVCAGETVYESRVAAAQNIKAEIARQVAAGTPDGQIKAQIERAFPDTVLVPDGHGVNALLWILPVIAVVTGLGALAIVFRRWKAEASALGTPTDDDRAMVAAALDSNDEHDREP
jgi:cytochrome c-type biogenesis protein CcmH